MRNFKEPHPSILVLQVVCELPKFFQNGKPLALQSLSLYRLAQHSLGAGPRFALKPGLGGEGPSSTCAPAVLRHLPLHQPGSGGGARSPSSGWILQQGWKTVPALQTKSNHGNRQSQGRRALQVPQQDKLTLFQTRTNASSQELGEELTFYSR